MQPQCFPLLTEPRARSCLRFYSQSVARCWCYEVSRKLLKETFAPLHDYKHGRVLASVPFLRLANAYPFLLPPHLLCFHHEDRPGGKMHAL